jgi:isopentenyl phosphate kinase
VSVTLLKIGGSIITDKSQPRAFIPEVMDGISKELSLLVRDPSYAGKIILGHGSGSYGHVEAAKYNTQQGVSTPDDWWGFTRVAEAASDLARLVVNSLTQHNIAAMRFSPSSSAIAENGTVIRMVHKPLVLALEHKLLPVVHGDVCFDIAMGGTIVSTEKVFSWLCDTLPVSTVVLLGKTDGVLDRNGDTIPRIDSTSLRLHLDAIAGSDGVDVTGGMRTKVIDMMALARAHPSLKIWIANWDTREGLVGLIKRGEGPGTLICA